jgi:hypothetical protein
VRVEKGINLMRTIVPIAPLLLTAWALTACTYGQGFQITDRCDERRLPSRDGSSIIGSSGCTAECVVAGDWLVAQIIYQEIAQGRPAPFVRDSNRRVNERTVGIFAHHLTEGRQWYCPIPRQWQQPWKDFDFFISARDQVCFSCAVAGTVKYGRWQIGDAPALIEPSDLLVQADRLPSDVRGRKVTRQVIGTTWYPGPPEPGESNALQVSQCRDGAIFCVSEDGDVFGQFSAATSAWKWRRPLADIFNSGGKQYSELRIPAIVPPLNSIAVAADVNQDDGQVEILLVDATEIAVVATVRDAHLFGVCTSPDQHLVLVEYSRANVPIDEFVQNIVFNTRTGTTIALRPVEEGVHGVMGISDSGQVIWTGDDYDVVVAGRFDADPNRALLRFDILLPAQN